MSNSSERAEARRRAELLKLLTSMVREPATPRGPSKEELRVMAADAISRSPNVSITRIAAKPRSG